MYVIAIVTGTAIMLSVLKLTESCVVYAFVHVCNSTVIDVPSMWLKQVSYIYIYTFIFMYIYGDGLYFVCSYIDVYTIVMCAYM